MPPVLTLVGAAALVLAVPALAWAFGGQAGVRAVSSNLGRPRAGGTDLRDALLARPAVERSLVPAVEALARRARRITPSGVLDRLEHQLLLAGGSRRWTIERILAAKLVLGLGGALLGLTLLATAPGLPLFLLAAALGTIGWFGPDVVLRSRAAERQQLIGTMLADTIDQVTVCVEAGLGFEAALHRAARSGRGPLRDELVRTLQDVQAGLSRAEALRLLVERTDVAELRQFVHAVVQADVYGVPIAQVLRVQAGELRVKRRQRAEERAMKLPVKIVFPLVLCILPSLFVVVLGPAAIRVAESLFGPGRL